MSIRRPHPVIASFVSALAMIAPLAVMCLVEINSDPIVLPSGEVDDAGLRGAGVTLLALPFLYIFCVVLCHVSGYVLLRFGCRTLRPFALFPLLTAVVFVPLVTVTLNSSPKVGALDIVVSSLVVAAVFGTIGSVGAAIWWWLAVKPYNSSLNPDSQPRNAASRHGL